MVLRMNGCTMHNNARMKTVPPGNAYDKMCDEYLSIQARAIPCQRVALFTIQNSRCKVMRSDVTEIRPSCEGRFDSYGVVDTSECEEGVPRSSGEVGVMQRCVHMVM